jgi:glycosyltransferase involved in cell wall biosynthesis
MPTPQPHVLVLLPSFNGAAFLDEQIASILGQTEVNTHLLCRDDGSSDASAQILARWANTHPERVTLLQTPNGNLGVKQGFSVLLEHALNRADPPATAYALADQDDVWHPQKLATLCQALETLRLTNPQAPLLVHSDLRVVDQTGRVMAERMSEYQGLRVQRSGFRSQLLSNTLTGCTALFNRRLLEQCTPIPPDCVMHDHWISLVASAFGHRHFVPTALVDYRQHAGNAVGAKAQLVEHQYQAPNRWRHWAHNIRLLLRHTSVAFNRDHQTIFAALSLQAEAFIRRFAAELPAAELAAARSVARLHRYPPVVQRVLFRWLR